MHAHFRGGALRFVVAGLVAGVSAITLACAAGQTPVPKPAPSSAAETDAGGDEDPPPLTSWRARRARPTRLLVESKAPAPVPTLHLPAGMEEVRYVSGGLSLLAVVARPPRTPVTSETPLDRLPAVLLLHAGFALDDDTLVRARSLVARGFVVMMPALRGANGNPGHYELWRGEVDDAKAAVRWLAADPEVDVDHLYAFGDAVGGGLATLLALEVDVPFRVIAAANGLYGTGTFTRWAADDPARIPFDLAEPDEKTVRLLLPNAHEVEQRLVLYVGGEDAGSVQKAKLARARAVAAGRDIEVVVLPGDAATAGAAALERFGDLVEQDAGGATSPLASRFGS